VRSAEEELNALQTKLNADYVVLRTRRDNLGTDPAALAAFNQDAATYAAAKNDLSLKAGRLAQLRADAMRLTDQVFLEAREKSKSNPKAVIATSQHEPVRAAKPKQISVGQGDVIMYTTRRCPACIAAKQYFARRGVPYTEFDVESNGAARSEFDKLGGRAVPLIIVKGRQMVGFNQAELEQLL
jgi:glutaredoxin